MKMDNYNAVSEIPCSLLQSIYSILMAEDTAEVVASKEEPDEPGVDELEGLGAQGLEDTINHLFFSLPHLAAASF